MFDGRLRALIDPPLDAAGRALARRGLSADHVTLAGLALGLACALAVFGRHDGLALALLAASRLLDGLDGAVARATKPSDRGGFLDITCDFVFYGAVPLAFALRDPTSNALPAAVLLFAFYVNGASFLAFAVMAAKRGLATTQRGVKSHGRPRRGRGDDRLFRGDDAVAGMVSASGAGFRCADAGDGARPCDSRVDNLPLGLAAWLRARLMR